MKTNHPNMNRLYCDRPLASDDAFRTEKSVASRRAYPGLYTDRVPEFFNAALQMALVACLLVSMAICGWKVSGFSEARSADIASMQVTKPAAPNPAVAQTETVKTAGYKMEKPALPHALKLSSRFFLVD